MIYRELKNTDIFTEADILEIYAAGTGEEIPDDVPEEILNNLTVESYSRCGGFLSVTLII